MKKKYKNITVIRNGAMGDFILTLPALATLRTAYPTSSIRLIAHPAFAALAAPETILNSSSARLAPLYSATTPLSKITQELFSSTDFILAYSTAADHILGHNLRQLVGAEFICHDPRPPAATTKHITNHLLAPLKQAGLPVNKPLPYIQLEQEALTFAQRWWRQSPFNKPVIIMHPGSGGRHKCWPLKRFVHLSQALEKASYQTLWLHGPADAHIATALATHLPTCCLLASPGPARLAALIQKARLFIGNDSGPAHMAAAVGTPTMVLFGPTDPRIWRPPHPHVVVIQAPNSNLESLQVSTVQQQALTYLQQL